MTSAPRESLEPIEGAARPWRRRLGLKDELLLALLPTITVLAVLGLLEGFSRQRLLFASLASSAFLIYLDPLHGTNSLRTLVGSHLLALTTGLGAFVLLGHGYPAAAVAMGLTIVGLIVLDLVHPPAVATSLLRGSPAGVDDAQSPILPLISFIGRNPRPDRPILLRMQPAETMNYRPPASGADNAQPQNHDASVRVRGSKFFARSVPPVLPNHASVRDCVADEHLPHSTPGALRLLPAPDLVDQSDRRATGWAICFRSTAKPAIVNSTASAAAAAA